MSIFVDGFVWYICIFLYIIVVVNRFVVYVNGKVKVMFGFIGVIGVSYGVYLLIKI